VCRKQVIFISITIIISDSDTAIFINITIVISDSNTAKRNERYSRAGS
jgi:hypothetical protein